MARPIPHSRSGPCQVWGVPGHIGEQRYILQGHPVICSLSIHSFLLVSDSPHALCAQPRATGLSLVQGAHSLGGGPMDNPHEAGHRRVAGVGNLCLPPATPEALLALQPLSLPAPSSGLCQANRLDYQSLGRLAGTGPWATFQAGRPQRRGASRGGASDHPSPFPAKPASVSHPFLPSSPTPPTPVVILTLTPSLTLSSVPQTSSHLRFHTFPTLRCPLGAPIRKAQPRLDTPKCLFRVWSSDRPRGYSLQVIPCVLWSQACPFPHRASVSSSEKHKGLDTNLSHGGKSLCFGVRRS